MYYLWSASQLVMTASSVLFLAARLVSQHLQFSRRQKTDLFTNTPPTPYGMSTQASGNHYGLKTDDVSLLIIHLSARNSSDCSPPFYCTEKCR